MASQNVSRFSDTYLRFERLFALQNTELDIALRVYGLHPELFSIDIAKPHADPEILTNLFASLSIPSSRSESSSVSRQRPCSQRHDHETSQQVSVPAGVLHKVLAHPPRSFYWSTSAVEGTGTERLEAIPSTRGSSFARAALKSKGIGVMGAKRQRPDLHRMPGRAAFCVNDEASELPVEVDFSESLQKDTELKVSKGDKKRFHEDAIGGKSKSRRAMISQSKDHAPGESEDDELDSALSGNPYCVAFNSIQRAALRNMAHEDNSKKNGVSARSSFRTAASKLSADRRDPSKSSRIEHGNQGECTGKILESDGEANDVSVAKLTRSLLGPARRPRFALQRAAAQARTGQNTDESASQRTDLPDIPNVEPRLVEMIMNDMLDRSPEVDWDDIAGLHFAKRCVMEAVVWPMKRPDIFTGLRGPPKGLLLFGPPGTGKTLIGRAIASKSGAKFFNISASSLMSKWVGEGEKMVRALFEVARVFQPSVVFIDEIDSLLTQRTETDQESSRRVKTEFLVQMDGAGTSRDDRVLVVGATNRPAELDEAARRRLVKRLYIPLPDAEARGSLVRRLLTKQSHKLEDSCIASIVKLTEGYSGSDLYALCAEAALGPVRDLGEAIGTVEVGSVRPIALCDFETAARMVRASVSDGDLTGYVQWNETYGSFPSK